MTGDARWARDLVTGLVPSLSRSLAEEFNVFRVMHHGTHEKQLSNVFAWLLDSSATHGLGDAFLRIFMARINAALPRDIHLPTRGYNVLQEVDTRGAEELLGGEASRDIADIVLTRQDAGVVVENFATSDGHGHDFHRYLAYAAGEGRRATVVLLCLHRDPHLQRDGWEQAVVVTYDEVLGDLRELMDARTTWGRAFPEQHFFLHQMIKHFVEGPASVDMDDQLAFIDAMCRTGESARFGQRPRDRVTEEFVALVAEHARQQFEESFKTLTRVKHGLRTFARTTLTEQVNAQLREGPISRVEARFVGQWEWCITLLRDDAHPLVFLEFGPTAVAEVSRRPQMLTEPDYSRVFVTRRNHDAPGINYIASTDVRLREVLEGLHGNDLRLRDAVLVAMGDD